MAKRYTIFHDVHTGVSEVYEDDDSGRGYGVFDWVSDGIWSVLMMLLTVGLGGFLFLVPTMMHPELWAWPWVAKLLTLFSNDFAATVFFGGGMILCFALGVYAHHEMESPLLALILPGILVVLMLICGYIHIPVVHGAAVVLMNVLILLALLFLLPAGVVVYGYSALQESTLHLSDGWFYGLFFVMIIVLGAAYAYGFGKWAGKRL